MSSPASTRPPRPAFPSARPRWAVEWSKSQRLKQGLPPRPSPSPDETPLPAYSPPPNRHPPVSVNPLVPARPSSRLSDHLTKDEQDKQAWSNDRAQQLALPSYRQSVSLYIDTTPPTHQVPINAWDSGTTAPEWDNSSSRQESRPWGSGPPRIEPSKVHEELLKRESIKPPVFGGRSKNQQLGSVAESWGTEMVLDIPKGMFELDDDPPSPTHDGTMSAAELREERARRMALGISAEKSGRPGIKEMEKEKIEKLRSQRLSAERQKNDIDMTDVSVHYFQLQS